MSKVFFLILSGVSLLPLAAVAMEEGEDSGVHERLKQLSIAVKKEQKGAEESDSPSEGKGKEKEKGESKEAKPQLVRWDGDLRLSTKTGVRRRPAVAQDPKPSAPTGRLKGLKAKLEAAQQQKNNFLDRITILFDASDVKSIFASRTLGGETNAVELRDGLIVNAKQILTVTNSVESAVSESYVAAFLQPKGPSTPQEMKKFFTSNPKCNSVHPDVKFRFNGEILLGNYEGLTVQTRRAEDNEDFNGKVLRFQLMVEDSETKKLVDLLYPFEDYKSELVWTPAIMTLSVTLNEGDKSTETGEKIN